MNQVLKCGASGRLVGEFQGYVDGQPSVVWLDRGNMPSVGAKLYAGPVLEFVEAGSAPAPGVDLAGLVRFGWCDIDSSDFIERPDGKFVRLADVEVAIAAAPSAPIGATVDTPELNALAARYGNSKAGKDYMALIAHIDQHVASQVRAAQAEPVVLADERMLFESEFDNAKGAEGTQHDVIGWYYFHEEVQAMWQAWEARAKVAAQAGQVAVTGWISTDDRLPENGKDVIILYWPYNNHENERIAGTAHHVEGTFYDEDGNDMHPPSHWMPFVIPVATPSPASESLRSPQEAAGTEKGGM